MNKILKEQAKEYYNRYKELKHSFYKERKVLHEKNTNLNNNIEENIDDNFKLKNINEELVNELGYIRKKFGMADKHLTNGKTYY